MTRRNLFTIIFTLLVAALAGVLTWQAISVGDDLGYCFADKSLHAGGGERVTSLSQVFSTQASHFMNFNGRIIVHSLTQIMLMPGMRWVYICLNALAFTLLWRVCMSLVWPGCFSIRRGVWMLMGLLLLMPAPGVIWFSLVAFSCNYLWPALLAMWLILLISKRESPMWLLLSVALLCGACQESFSLPLLGALILLWLRRRQKRQGLVIVFLFIGCLCLLCAPGNYSHLSSGGGFNPSALGHKCLMLIKAIPLTPILLPLVVMMVPLFVKRVRPALKPRGINTLLCLCIAASLLFACVSFTAVRQLVFPSLCALVLLYRLAVRFAPFILGVRVRRIIFAVCTLLFIFSTGLGLFLRHQTKMRMDRICSEISTGKVNVYVDAVNAQTSPFSLIRWMAANYAADPLDDGLLPLCFDPNTLKGLGRLYLPPDRQGKRPSVFPLTRQELERLGIEYRKANPAQGKTLRAHPLSPTYSIVSVAVKDTLPKYKETPGTPHLRYTGIRLDTIHVLVLPAECEAVVIK